MIPKHSQFLEAVNGKKKVSLRFYSKPDNGVLERICAPISYGPGENHDGLNRYWLWDYASTTGVHTLGLVPQQIVELQVLGERFDPIPFACEPSPAVVPQTEGLPPLVAVASSEASVPKL